MKALHWAGTSTPRKPYAVGQNVYSTLPFFHPRASRMRGVFSDLRRLQSRTKGTLQGHVESGGARARYSFKNAYLEGLEQGGVLRNMLLALRGLAWFSRRTQIGLLLHSKSIKLPHNASTVNRKRSIVR